MESITIKFTANGQTLTGGGLYCASNTVRYIIAEFDLGDNWQGYDSVRAVWSNDFKCISTVLDPSGSCTVPHEVLERRGKVSVNLVGSILEDDELTDRLTTYPVLAITVDANAKICGTETAEVTPSQFEQYVAIVIAEVEKVTGMTAIAHSLPEGSEPTANYSGGVLTLGIPKGDTGATGNGISGVEFNEDYSLTFYFTDSEPFTTPSIRGAQGARGYGIASVEKIGSAGLVDTYRINFEDPSVPPTTFTVTNGEEGPQGPRGYTGETGNGIESVYLTETHGAVKTYTILFTDGTTTTFDVTDGEVTLAELASVLPTDTASGAIASFEDGSDLFDYLSCIVNIEPIQDLHGYDKPWVGGAGKNKFNPQPYTGIGYNANIGATVTLTEASATFENNTISYTIEAWYNRVFRTPKLSQGSYKISMTNIAITSPRVSVYEVSGTDNTIVGRSNYSELPTDWEPVFSITENGNYLVLVIGSNTAQTLSFSYPQIEAGSTKTTYAPYSNICPITGWTGCEVDVAGVNLIDASDVYQSSANRVDIGTQAFDYHTYLKAGTYTFSNNGVGVAYCQLQGASSNIEIHNQTVQSGTFTITQDGYYAFWVYYWNGISASDVTDVQLELGSTATAYEEYVGTTYPVSWQTEAGTVYGGTVDLVTGVLTVEMVTLDLGTLSWVRSTTAESGKYRFTATITGIKKASSTATVANILSSQYQPATWADTFNRVDGTVGVSASTETIAVYDSRYETDTKENFKTAMSGVQLVYELATPQTSQLDPVQVACLLWQNNVWADCGSIDEVKYKADVQLWVEKQLREINTAILALS